MSTFKLLNAAEVEARIPVLRKNLRDSEQEIHVIGCSVLDHAREFGDTRGVSSLLNALPNGTRAEGLAAWMRAFSNKKLILKRGDGRLWSVEIKKDRADADFDITAAMAVTFADYTNEPAQKEITLEKLLQMVTRVANDDKTLPSGAPRVNDGTKAVAAEMLAFVRSKAVAKAA